MGVARLTQSESPDAADADERLLQRCRAGSEEAFATLVSRYEAQLTRHCARLIGTAAAQDAVQDAFLSAWVALQAGAEVRAARPWLFTIAHRKALAALRDQRRTGVELSEASATSRSPEEVVAESANVRRAFAALAALPGAQRHALLDSAVHGRSGTQIASSLGVSESAVRQLVFKARASVRTAAAACLVPPLFVLAALRRVLAGVARRASALHGAASGQLASATLGAKLGALAIVGAAVVGAGALHEISASSPPPAHRSAATAHRAVRHRVARTAEPAAHHAVLALRPTRGAPSRGVAVTARGVVLADASRASASTGTAELSASSEGTKVTDQGAGTSATTGATGGGSASSPTGTSALAGVSATVGSTSTTAGKLAGEVTQTVHRVVPDTLGTVTQAVQGTVTQAVQGTVTQAVQGTVTPAVGAVSQTVQNAVTSATGAVGSATNAVTQTAQGAVSVLTGATGTTGTTGVTGLLGGLGKLVGGH